MTEAAKFENGFWIHRCELWQVKATHINTRKTEGPNIKEVGLEVGTGKSSYP